MGLTNEKINLVDKSDKNDENINQKINILKSVKSKYILEIIFSKLNEKKKLRMIIYNKNFQKKLGININDYKTLSGKLFVGEKNGIGKEYVIETNKLLFEGNYLNGKRNGKGKVYWDNGKIQFEGVFLNGAKIKGKEYNPEGKTILKINENGKVEEYYDNNDIKFKGEYLNG